MSNYNLTKLADMLLNPEMQSQSDRGCVDEFHQLLKTMDSVAPIAVYLDSENEYANVENLLNIMDILIKEAGYTGDFLLGFNMADAGLCSLIAKKLAFFDAKSSFTYAGCSVKPVDTRDVRTWDAKLVICGNIETEPIESNQNIKYIFWALPYLDSEISRFLIREPEEGSWLTFLTDAMSLNQIFSMRPYRRNLEQISTVSEQEREWWKRTYENIELCEELLSLKKEAVLIPVAGLKTSGKVVDRGDNVTLLLTLALLESMAENGKPVVLAFLDYTKPEDSHFELLRLFLDEKKGPDSWPELLRQRYPEAEEEQLRAGLITPLMRKRTALAGKLERIRWVDSVGGLKPGTISILPLGELPGSYEKALFASAEHLFLGRQEYINFAVNLGKPFLQKPVEAGAENYPDLERPEQARAMEQLCVMFEYDITAYTSALDKELYQEISDLAGYFSNPAADYFKALGTWAQAEENDKLAAGLGLFSLMKKEVEKSTPGKDPTLEQLYKNLQAAYDSKEKIIKLNTVLKDMRIASYLAVLSAGKDFELHLDSAENIKLELFEGDGGEKPKDPEIYAVSIQDGNWNDITLNIEFTSWRGGKTLSTKLTGSVHQTATLLGIPWLEFKDADFSVTIPENKAPMWGRVGGTLASADLYLAVDLNAQNGTRRILAQFWEPKTVLDAFYAIAGGVDFQAAMPEELKSLGNFGLHSLEFYYDSRLRKITSMGFSLATGSPWVLWEREGEALLTAAPSVEIRVYNPADVSARQIWLGVEACVGVGENGEVGTLFLSGSYPPFKAQLRLASEKLSLDKLLELFGAKVDIKSDITDLRMLADFENRNYQIAAAIESDWEIVPNVFTLTELGLVIHKAGDSLSIAFAGSILLCGKLNIGAMAAWHDGSWKIKAKAAIGEKLKLNDLLMTCQTGIANALEEDADNPFLASLSLDVEKAKDGKYTWNIAAQTKNWSISAIGLSVEGAEAAVGYRENEFYAELTSSLYLLGAKFEIRMIYGSKQKEFWLKWEKFTGQIISDEKGTRAEIGLKDFSIGELIEAFTQWCMGAPFKLDSPWDILNEWKEKELNLCYDFTTSVFSVSAAMSLELGFASLQGVKVVYDRKAEQKIKVALQGTFAWQEGNEISWDAAKPGTAPAPDGKGAKYLDLRLLAFGQKMHFFDAVPESTQDAITNLKKKLDPEKLPAYDETAGWLVAADFGILKDGSGKYFLDTELVFYDPSLFALRFQLAGSAAKIFDGFSFEILYAKLSDTLGVYKGTIALPDRFRRFDIGAYAVSMPDFYVEVYTNGDFKVDLGFPKKGDFSRSFTLEGIIPPGIPVTGSAGLYFGKLSSASAQSAGVHLPQTNTGLFNPAIVFGFGLRFGVGKSVNYGILSGGFSLTLTAILEGVAAKWCPYASVGTSEDTQWYWYLKGSAAIVGELYGKIDFAIICASVNVSIGVSVGFEYETCRAVSLIICAQVKASASLTIDLGLFKIDISFHFEIQVKESLQIGENQRAPWDENSLNAMPLLFFQNGRADALALDFTHLKNAGRRTELPALMVLSVTAASDEWKERGWLPIGNVILTLKDGEGKFEVLAETVLLWTLAAGLAKNYTCDELRQEKISDSYLADLEAYLKDAEQSRMPIPYRELETFLGEFFEICVLDNGAECARLELENEKNNSGTLFPLPPGLSFSSSTDSKVQCSYTLAEYNRISETALGELRKLFDELAVTVEREQQKMRGGLRRNEEIQCSMAEWVFCDWFLLVVRQGIRGMRKALRDMGRESVVLADILQRLREDSLYDNLSGMVSRYHLHGLRLPTVEKETGRKWIEPLQQGLWVRKNKKTGALEYPEELGMHGLSGAAFLLPSVYEKTTEFAVKPLSNLKYLHIPENFQMGIGTADGSADVVCSLLSYLETGKFALEYQLKGTRPQFKPAEISFAAPVTQKGVTLWEVPASLKAYYQEVQKAYPLFSLELSGHTEDGLVHRSAAFKPLVLIEFSVEQTETEDTYRITGGSETNAKLLWKLLQAMQTDTSLVTSAFLLGGREDCFFAVSQVDLSTETKPFQISAENGQRPVFSELRNLWKALVTNNGGYVLTYREGEQKLEKNATLVVQLKEEAFAKGEYGGLVNGVRGEAEPETNEVLTARATSRIQQISYEGTLENLWKEYSSEPYSFAEENALILLREGARWSFENLVYQAYPNRRPGCMLTDIAAYFRVGREDILSLNRNRRISEKLKEGQAILIPAFETVSMKGDTLAGFAKRYFQEVPLLLWQNRTREALFAEGTVVKVQICAGSLMASGSSNTTSAINEEYNILRKTPGELPEPQSTEYSKVLLENNYSLLRYSVADTGDFTESGYSMPISAAEDWSFRAAMPVDSYCGGNYSSVGRLLQNRFEWLDLYGNSLPADFLTARLIGYQDELLGLSRWQSVSSRWDIAEKGLQLELSFAAQDYLQSAASANFGTGAEKAAYAERCYEYLWSQMNDGSVEFFLKNTLFTEQKFSVEKKPVTEWIKKIHKFLQDVVKQEGGAEPPDTLRLCIPCEDRKLSPEPLLPVEMEFIVHRNGAADAGCYGVESVLESSALISLPEDKREFSRSFKKVFPSHVVLQSGQDSSLYAFRVSELSVKAAGKGCIYLPRPISNVPESREEVMWNSYVSGKGFDSPMRKTYREVDLNVWLKKALELFDEAFSPEIVSAVRTAELDYEFALNQKKALAENLSDLLCGADVRQEGECVPSEAREPFLQKLLSKLSNYYGVKAIVAAPIQVIAPTMPTKTRFYGFLEAENKLTSVGLSSPKLELASGEGTAADKLVFSVSGPEIMVDNNGAVIPYAEMSLNYRITHIEKDIAAAVDGFEQSAWLNSFEDGILAVKLDSEEIPFPLYTFPETPMLEYQQAEDGDSIFEWKYCFAYSLSRHYPQMVCHCRVCYNAESDKLAAGGGKDVFAALAQIIETGDAVLADLKGMAAALHQKSKEEVKKDSESFRLAWQCMSELMEILANAGWDRTVRSCISTGETITFQVKEGIYDGEALSILIEGDEAAAQVMPRIEGFESIRAGEEKNLWIFKAEDGKLLSAAEGQGIRRREILMPSRNRLSYQNAAAQIYVEQNRNLCSGSDMQDCFVFTTGTVGFDMPLFALKEEKEALNMAEYFARDERRHGLYEYLDAFLAAVSGKKQELRLSVLVRYAGKPYAELPGVEQPVFFQNPVAMQPDAYDEIIGKDGTWMEALRKWRKEFPEENWKKGEKILFSFTFLSGRTGKKMPILVLPEVYLDGERIDTL